MGEFGWTGEALDEDSEDNNEPATVTGSDGPGDYEAAVLRPAERRGLDEVVARSMEADFQGPEYGSHADFICSALLRYDAYTNHTILSADVRRELQRIQSE